ncbi:MAG: hydrophobe/amphiphile efflux-1 family RND transporter, partial [Candidatus Omnitrophica bacterium CG12_big_fil_rev_8_21_14_0_65_50_5]
PKDAMIEAGRARLRPILMTAVSTIVGILPIAIGFGAGAESRRPLGVAAEGGMITSTFLTLFVIPVVYVLFSRRKKKSLPLQSNGEVGIAVNVPGEPSVKKEKTPSRWRNSLCLLIAGAFLLSGCSLRPVYDRPSVKMPAQWKAPQDSDFWKIAQPQDHLPKGSWWTIFNNQDLNRLEDLAVANNQNLKSAIAGVMQARATARVVSSVRYPSVGVDPSVQRRWESEGGNFLSEGETTDTFSLPLDLSYESDFWDFWGRVRSLSEAGWAAASAEQAAFQTVLLTLNADVAYYYFQLGAVDQELFILEETIGLRRDAVDLVSRRVEAGIGKELDLNRAKTELAQAQTTRVDAQRRRAELENALAVLCGQAASDFSVDPVALDDFVPTVPVSVPSSLLERRPDVARAERL